VRPPDRHDRGIRAERHSEPRGGSGSVRADSLEDSRDALGASDLDGAQRRRAD